MQAPNISIKNLTLNFHASHKTPMPALAMLGAALAAGAGVKPEVQEQISAPAIGQVWPGQGGFNGGLVAARGDVPEHYLIIAAKDVGDHEWGGRGKESGATSKTDGYGNTEALRGSDEDHPAADACAKHQADGHSDYYLPAAAELYHCWVNCPEVFAQDCYYWSSSQRSASAAFGMDFDDGTQDTNVKNYELRVRPVRRLFI